MVTIRKGKMQDCKNLLTVYETTRWYYRTKDGGYKTVEEVKDEHKGTGFKNWGWLVAEEDNSVIGEIVFRIEKNPIIGRIGIIRNLDVDVRYQKKTIGTQLVRAAESILKQKKASRIVSLTPPEAYNFWMKVDYFARGSLINISTTPSKLKTKNVKGIKAQSVKDTSNLPKSMNFSNIAIPGQMCDLAGLIIDEKKKGRMFEFTNGHKLIGIGAIVKTDNDTAFFAIDALTQNDEHIEGFISKVLSASSILKAKKIKGVIPKDRYERFKKVARWSVEDTRDIPVTRII